MKTIKVMMDYLKPMKFNIVQLFCALTIFASCSKNDDSSSDTKTQEEIEETAAPEIDLKFFGKGLNSSEESVEIFKTANGYISFENQNRPDIKIFQTYEGDGDIVMRKLDNKLEQIEEYVFDTETIDELYDVSKIDENTFVLIGRINTEEPFFDSSSVPFIRIVNTNGEVIKSTLIGTFETNTDDYLAQISYENGVIYIAAALTFSKTLITALDLELNELWRNTIITRWSNGKIIVNNEELLYAYQNGIDNDVTIKLKRFNLLTGELISTYEYDSEKGKTFELGQIRTYENTLYIAGRYINQNWTGYAGYLLRVNMNDWTEIDKIYDANMYQFNDIIIAQDNILIGGNPKEGNGILKVNHQGEIIWKYDLSRRASVERMIRNNDGTIIFTANVIDSEDSSTEVMIGILNEEGVLQ